MCLALREASDEVSGECLVPGPIYFMFSKWPARKLCLFGFFC